MASAFWWAPLTLARLLSLRIPSSPYQGFSTWGDRHLLVGTLLLSLVPSLFLPLAVLEGGHYLLHQVWLSRWRPQ